MSHGPHMRPRCANTNPVDGKVVWEPVKSLWYLSMIAVALVAGPSTWSWQTSLVACLLTMFTLCCGHSIGFHRLIIHRSFECPRWLEYLLVTIGTLVGMGGPTKMLYMHDIRDWSQRHPKCHAFFIHQSGILKDWWWNLNCEIRLDSPPEFVSDSCISQSVYYRFLDRTWLLLQIPLALVLYFVGGWSLVVWGGAVRVAMSLTGHWIVGYLAHNVGPRTWHLEGHAVQGYNVPGFGLLSMGEAWHNNHHAFPESAKFGLERGQNDPGWWFICALERLGLAWNLKQPEDLPERSELKRIEPVMKEVHSYAQSQATK